MAPMKSASFYSNYIPYFSSKRSRIHSYGIWDANGEAFYLARKVGIKEFEIYQGGRIECSEGVRVTKTDRGVLDSIRWTYDLNNAKKFKSHQEAVAYFQELSIPDLGQGKKKHYA